MVKHNFCDYEYGNCACESKTIFDFTASIKGERVFKQVDKMPDSYYKMVMIIGTIEQLLADKHFKDYPENRVYGAVASLMVRQNVHVLWGMDHKSTVPVLYKVMKKVSEGKWGKPRVYYVKHTTKTRAGDLLRNFLRIDANIANAIVRRAKKKKMGAIRYILEAKDSELMMISGVGPVTLKRIRELVG